MTESDRSPVTTDQPVRDRSRREQVRLVGSFALGALAVLFAVLNLDEVEVNWIIGTWDTPLIVVIASSLVVGAAIGWVLSVRRR